jgi:hypothetical protein
VTVLLNVAVVVVVRVLLNVAVAVVVRVLLKVAVVVAVSVLFRVAVAVVVRVRLTVAVMTTVAVLSIVVGTTTVCVVVETNRGLPAAMQNDCSLGRVLQSMEIDGFWEIPCQKTGFEPDWTKEDIPNCGSP